MQPINLAINTINKKPPEIKDIKMITQDNKHIGVIVYFTDGTKQKAVAQKGDVFDLEVGIAFCLLKWYYAMNTDKSDGTKNFNDAIRKALKIKKIMDAERAKEEEEKQIKERQKKKQKARRQKRAMQKREARINEIAEAIRRSK